MKNFEDFVKDAIDGNGIQNDENVVWVEVEGRQYTVNISDVLDHDEVEPFEASYALERNFEHPVWEDLYGQYKYEHRD